MFLKRPRHRIFDYTPRFYNPDEDEEERRKRRLGFRRGRKIKGNRVTSPIIWLLLVVIVLYLYLKLSGIL
jgi:hypothetical protein